MHYVYVMVYISLAVAMQLLTGNFPVSFFAFPLNLVFAVLWLFLLWMLYKEYKLQNLPDSSILPKQVSYLSDYSSAVA